MGSSYYSGAAINYSKRSFKTKNLSRKKLSDSNEKTKQKKKKKKISISEEEHSREGEAFGREQERSDGRKNNNTPSRRNETSFYGPAPFGDLDQDPTHVSTRAGCIYGHAAEISKNIQRKYSPFLFVTPFTPTKDLMTQTLF